MSLLKRISDLESNSAVRVQLALADRLELAELTDTELDSVITELERRLPPDYAEAIRDLVSALPEDLQDRVMDLALGDLSPDVRALAERVIALDRKYFGG